MGGSLEEGGGRLDEQCFTLPSRSGNNGTMLSRIIMVSYFCLRDSAKATSDSRSWTEQQSFILVFTLPFDLIGQPRHRPSGTRLLVDSCVNGSAVCFSQ
jgi:hypothetical protein